MIDRIDTRVLTDELQLNGRLPKAIEQGQRTDFSLLLAMLSANVCDQAQFQMPEPQTQTASLNLPVPPKSRLYGHEDDVQWADQRTEAFHQGGLASTWLLECLQPDPLIYPPQNTAGLRPEVYGNMSYTERDELEGKKTTKAADHRTQLFLTCLQAARTQASLSHLQIAA
ncbi:VC2046/SO_2500 family protein [Plesiomonas sp.]|uniref:VC2046/SO_2500 family protein n=1 Tax=Plesiomonas sp. TaxID=2486279 RepID=UPI003F40053C